MNYIQCNSIYTQYVHKYIVVREMNFSTFLSVIRTFTVLYEVKVDTVSFLYLHD